MDSSTNGKRIQSVSGVRLTPRQRALLNHFDVMDRRAQREFLEEAEYLATKWPRRSAVTLRLVVGGAA